LLNLQHITTRQSFTDKATDAFASPDPADENLTRVMTIMLAEEY
jgi:hypothetical protein